MNLLKMYPLLKIQMFHCYVSFPEGNPPIFPPCLKNLGVFPQHRTSKMGLEIVTALLKRKWRIDVLSSVLKLLAVHMQ